MRYTGRLVLPGTTSTRRAMLAFFSGTEHRKDEVSRSLDRLAFGDYFKLS